MDVRFVFFYCNFKVLVTNMTNVILCEWFIGELAPVFKITVWEFFLTANV